jgi:hypothetical protein
MVLPNWDSFHQWQEPRDHIIVRDRGRFSPSIPASKRQGRRRSRVKLETTEVKSRGMEKR